MFGILDDVVEIGSEIAVGVVTGTIGATIGKEVASKLTDGNKTAENIGSIVGSISVGASGTELAGVALDILGDSNDSWRIKKIQ